MKNKLAKIQIGRMLMVLAAGLVISRGFLVLKSHKTIDIKPNWQPRPQTIDH
jgi:hypothetical protein